ncbi:hypothetical protein [Plantactinospora sp. GCM10030261]|uniref:hypothetical protein n=1 Tax=Plantactinospora sp. GCM10030261 TaxID=3273420 RepID=UPI003623F102
MKRHTGTARGFRRHLFAAALLSVTVGMTACGTVEKATDKATQLTAKETLLDAVPDGSEGPFRFSGNDGTTDLTGSVDPAAKGIHLETSMKDQDLGFTTDMSFLVIGEQPWVKISFKDTKGVSGLPKLPAKWLRIDPSRVADKADLPTFDGVDQGNTGPLIQAATTVEDQGNGKYAGTIDLTSGEAAKVLEAEQMTALGEAAKQVPFTATVGPDKHLASLTMEVPAAGTAKAFTYSVNYADYGKAEKLAAPEPAAAQDAPPVVYEMLYS